VIVNSYFFASFLSDFVETLEVTSEGEEVEVTSEKVILATESELNVVQGKSGQNN